MLLHPNNIALEKPSLTPPGRGSSLVTGMVSEVSWTVGSPYLTSIHNFSAIIRKEYFCAKEVPPFHLRHIIHLIINVLDKVELG